MTARAHAPAAQAAPPELRAVEDLCNTAVHLHGTDALEPGANARVWLAAHGADPSAGPGELARLRADRETLRGFLANRADPAARSALNALVRRHGARARVGADGLLALLPEVDGSPTGAAIESLLLHGLGEGGARLKVCAAPDCRYVFYDRSRPRTRVWCDMNVCGARSKMRGYRAREEPGGRTEAEQGGRARRPPAPATPAGA